MTIPFYTPPSSVGIFFFNQDPAQHLAHHGLGQLLAELHEPGDFIGHQFLLAPGLDLLGSSRFTGLEHHPGFYGFALLGIGYAGHAHLGNCGVRRDHLLNLARPHLEAAGLDEVLLARGYEHDSRPHPYSRYRRCKASRP